MSSPIGLFARDLQDSSSDFISLVYPALKGLNFIRGKVLSIEQVSDPAFKELARQLDMLSGIDAFQIVKGEGIKGIGNRIQWGETAWDTFTIRKERVTGSKTEYEKRQEALGSEAWIYPHLTIQSYISKRKKGVLLSLAICLTKDLYRFIEEEKLKGSNRVRERRNHADGNSFLIVKWSDLKEAGIHINIYKAKQ